MLFSSLPFIFIFLPVFLVCFYLVKRNGRRWLLLLGSMVFYAMGEPDYILLLGGSVIVNYALSLVMCARDAETKKVQRRVLFLFILCLDLSVLFLFKYRQEMPLGISFYTFQILSYQIDCYNGKKKRPATFLDFAVLVFMFPHLVMGPLLRFGDIRKELKQCGGNLGGLEHGARNFTIGLGLKVLLANQLSSLYNGIEVIGADLLSVPLAWLGAAAFSMQIYFDFWGYSMMAIGLGEMLGITIPENFRQPYHSKSISEFWRRWHITLGEWFKDYVYVPLGGNRKGLPRTFLNLLIVWLLTGFWHGASWNFLIWGIVFFVLIAFEKAGLGKWLEKTKVLGHVYVLCVMPVTWVIFSKTDMRELVQYISCMFGVGAVSGATQLNQFFRFVSQYLIFLLAGALFITPLPAKLYRKCEDKWYVLPVLVAVFWFSVYQIYTGANNPFLYLRF